MGWSGNVTWAAAKQRYLCGVVVVVVVVVGYHLISVGVVKQS